MAKLGTVLTMDHEIVADFKDCFDEHYEIIINCIMMLDKDPNDTGFIDEVFRSLHTIKGNASMCQMDSLAEFTHSIEDVISALREGAITYSDLLGEAVLLALDKAKELAEDLFADRDINYELLNSIQAAIQQIELAPSAEIRKHCSKVISLITGHIIDTPEKIISSGQLPPLQDENNNLVAVNNIMVLDINSIKELSQNFDKTTPCPLQDGMAYFRYLNLLLEAKLPYWNNRLERTLPLAKGINKALENPVEPHQLEVAVYIHDIAYAFLSETLILKQEKFDAKEKSQMKTHPQIAADLLRLIPGWDAAVEIIEQHHEHWDGGGYPHRLKGDEICTGAQILAVVDAFESMTHPRPDRPYKRSILRGITEVNKCTESQFAPQIIPVFNQILRKLIIENGLVC